MADADHRFVDLVSGASVRKTPISSSSGASDGGKIVKTKTSDGKLDKSLLDIDETANKESFTQVGHGLVVGNVVKFTGSTWSKAQANSLTNSIALGFVDYVSGNDFRVVYPGGRINGLSLIADNLYYLSASGAGTITSSIPSGDNFSVPVLYSTSPTSGIVLGQRPMPGLISSLMGLTMAGNGLKALRVNSAGNSMELYTPSVSSVLRKFSYGINSASVVSTIGIPYDDTIPQITEGAEALNVAFTPTASDSIIVIDAIVGFGSPHWNRTASLFKDSGANAIASHNVSTGAAGNSVIPLMAVEVAGSTALRTYRARFGGDGTQATTSNYIFSTSNFTSIKIWELAP